MEIACKLIPMFFFDIHMFFKCQISFIDTSIGFFRSMVGMNRNPILTLFIWILCSYSTIAWVACVYHGRVEDVSYAYLHETPATTVFRVLNSLGVIGFAYAGHNVALEIQATIPSSPERPSKIPMWRGVMFAYFIVALCYFPVAIVGYWAFGQTVSDNLLLTLKKPDWLIAAANMMVGIHVIGSYQVFF